VVDIDCESTTTTSFLGGHRTGHGDGPKPTQKRFTPARVLAKLTGESRREALPFIFRAPKVCHKCCFIYAIHTLNSIGGFVRRPGQLCPNNSN